MKIGYAHAYNDRGRCKKIIKDYQGAIEDFNTAIELKDDDVEFYFNRGNCKYDMRDFRGATHDFDLAINLKDDVPEFYINRGNSYKTIGET